VFRQAPAVTLLALLATASAAFAQQPPDRDLQDKTDEPTSAQLPPPRQQADPNAPGFVQKAQRFIKEKRIVERLSPRDGVYPRVGGLTTGSGFALGAGYRHHLYDDRLFADASAIISMKNYKAVDLRARWLRLFDNRLEFWTNYRYHSFPEEDFFGIGPESSEATRTSYKITGNDIVTRGVFAVNEWLHVGADLGFYSPDISHGLDAALPSLERVFDDGQAPGLANQPNFMHHSLFAEFDTRDHRGHPTRGGLYRASFSTWDDTTLQQYNFRRFDGDASRFIPLHGDKHVAAIRVGASLVNTAGGDRVPFYFLPYVGGSDTVRGLVEFRYRDENVAFMNAEYRWSAHKYIDIVPFFDVGKVAHDWQGITLRDLKTGYGIGARVHTTSQTFFRIDVGTGAGEGTNVFVKFGPSF
jgi:hypothetical protein